MLNLSNLFKLQRFEKKAQRKIPLSEVAVKLTLLKILNPLFFPAPS